MASLAGGTPRLDEHVLQLNDEKYFVATAKDGHRLFKVTRISAQGNIPLDEQAIALPDLSEGSGISFDDGRGGYEQADGWDCTTPGKAVTWPRFAVGEAFTTADSQGRSRQIGQYYYAARGRYVKKYIVDDTFGSTWAIQDSHDLGASEAICGPIVDWQGKGYFPHRSGTSGALGLYHELTTINAPATPDTWTTAAATLGFSGFAVWKEQLRASIGNLLYSCSTTPLVAANWLPPIGSGYAVGDSGQDITDMVAWPEPDEIWVCKTDGLWTFGEALKTRNAIPELRAVIAADNGRYARVGNGYAFIPSKLGLVHARPGAYRFVGPEMDGTMEATYSGTRGWGTAAGIASTGRQTFVAFNDIYNGIGTLVSFNEPYPGQRRGALVPHTHAQVTGRIEALSIISTQNQGIAPRTPVTITDDSAVGTITWGTPTNAGALDGSYATATAGTSHYLKALNPANGIPSTATVTGILAEVAKKAGGSVAPLDESLGGRVYGQDATFSTARGTAFATDSNIIVGQGVGTYLFSEGFISFDTSAIPDTATVLTATLSLRLNSPDQGAVAAGSVIQARLQDWGATLALGDFVAGSSITGTLLATLPASGFSTTALAPLTSESAFISNISLTGKTRIMLCTDRMVAGTTPTATELSFFYGGAGGAGFAPTLTVTYTNSTVDNVVKLVVAGSVVGSNLADAATAWPVAIGSYTQYGGSNNLWGLTPTVAQVNGATFGVVFSATVGTGDTASVDHIRMTVYYTMPGAIEPSSFVAYLTVDATGLITTPHIRKLPRADLTIANDPNVQRQNSNCTLTTPRYYLPSRTIKKTWRAHEFWADLSPSTNTPGLQVWATVDDGTAFQLLDEDGVAATLTVTGRQRVFFPRTSASVGHYVQLQYRVPATSGGQVGLAVALRDRVLYQTMMPSRTDRISATVILGEGEFEDGMSMRDSIAHQRTVLEALADPNSAPITYRDPVSRTEGYIRVADVDFDEELSPTGQPSRQIARLLMYRATYDDES